MADLCSKKRQMQDSKILSIWDNVSFHHSPCIREWFEAQPHVNMEFLPSYSPFLNLREEFLFSWRWKVFDHQPYQHMALLDLMNAACEVITTEDCWIRYPGHFFPQCTTRESTTCDENFWPDSQERVDE